LRKTEGVKEEGVTQDCVKVSKKKKKNIIEFREEFEKLFNRFPRN